MTSSQKKILYYLLIPPIVFLVFLPSLFCDFTNWDDNWMLTNNHLVRKLSFEQITQNIFGRIYQGVYQPLVFLSYAIEYHFWKLDPLAYHLTNLFLHILNTILVFIFINQISGNKSAALVACLFWSLNPLRVESVTWITERKDLLYAFFYMLSLIKYVHYLKSGKKKIHFILSLLFFLLSCLSKLTAVSLSFMIVLLDYFYYRKFDLKSIAEKAVYFILSLVVGCFSIWAVKSDSFSNDKKITSFVYPIAERIQLVSHSFINYILKTVIPYNLSAFHPYQYSPGNLPSYYLFFLFLALGIIAALAWLFIKYKNRKLIFGILFFVSAVVFALQIFPVGDAAFADRNIYISSIGIAFLTGELYLILIKKYSPKIVITIGGFLLLIYGFLTRQQTKIWKDSITLFTDIIEKYPDSDLAYVNRGAAKYFKKEYRNSISDYEIALIKKPDSYMAMVNIALSLKSLNDFSGALSWLDKSLKIYPGYERAFFTRGEVYFEMKKFRESIQDFTRNIELTAQNPFQASLALTNRSRSRIALNETDSAIIDLNIALDIIPDNSDSWYLMGLCYYSSNELRQAKTNFLKTVEINPRHEIALFYLGMTEIALGDLKKGCDYFLESAQLSYPDAQKMHLFYCGDPEIKKKIFYLNGKLKFQLIKGMDSKKDSVYHLCNFDSLGKMLQQGVFDLDMGKYNGEIRWYYPDGSLKKTGFSRNDTTYGQWKEFYPDSTLRAEYFYANGEMDSIYRHYYPNSNLWIERIYQKGRLIKINACNDINGKPLKPGSFSNGNGSLNIFDESGKVIMVQQYKNGLMVQ